MDFCACSEIAEKTLKVISPCMKHMTRYNSIFFQGNVLPCGVCQLHLLDMDRCQHTILPFQRIHWGLGLAAANIGELLCIE